MNKPSFMRRHSWFWITGGAGRKKAVLIHWARNQRQYHWRIVLKMKRTTFIVCIQHLQPSDFRLDGIHSLDPTVTSVWFQISLPPNRLSKNFWHKSSFTRNGQYTYLCFLSSEINFQEKPWYWTGWLIFSSPFSYWMLPLHDQSIQSGGEFQYFIQRSTVYNSQGIVVLH